MGLLVGLLVGLALFGQQTLFGKVVGQVLVGYGPTTTPGAQAVAQ